MNIKKIALISILVLGLVLGLTLPALADEESTSLPTNNVSPKMLSGEVISIDQSAKTFIIQSRDQQFTIVTNGETKYFWVSIPHKIVNASTLRVENGQDQITLKLERGLTRYRAQLMAEERLELSSGFATGATFNDTATFDDITVGALVKVRVVPEGVNLLAKQVLIIERLVPNNQVITGIIAGISLANKTITITPADGSQNITLTYNESTRFFLRGAPGMDVGQSVRATHNADLVAKIVFMPATPAETNGAG